MEPPSEQGPITEIPQREWTRPFLHYDSMPLRHPNTTWKVAKFQVADMGIIEVSAIHIREMGLGEPSMTDDVFYFNGVEEKILPPEDAAVLMQEGKDERVRTVWLAAYIPNKLDLTYDGPLWIARLRFPSGTILETRSVFKNYEGIDFDNFFRDTRTGKSYSAVIASDIQFAMGKVEATFEKEH